MIEITALRWVPPRAQGYVKDLRVRWALEEAGLPYRVEKIDATGLASDDHRLRQPFGLVPTFREPGIEMFESGAIVLHLAERYEPLGPRDPAARARMMSWVLAALTTLEPHVDALNQLDTFDAGGSSTAPPRAEIEARLGARLAALEHHLAGREHLDGGFTAGDLMMTMVLRELEQWPGLAAFSGVDAYWRRCVARPAFGRALEAQLRDFEAPATA